MGQVLVWCDLETTGLDPRVDQILEVAVSLADLHDPFTFTTTVDSVFWFPQHWSILLTSYVKEMHTRSGLLTECASPASPPLWQVERRLLQVIDEVESRDDRPTLAGSSVHFDHEFIKWYMPKLAKRLSHRHYDVSSLKLYCESMGMPRLPKAEAHRARLDINESVRHAKECTTWLRSNLFLDDSRVNFDLRSFE